MKIKINGHEVQVLENDQVCVTKQYCDSISPVMDYIEVWRLLDNKLVRVSVTHKKAK